MEEGSEREAVGYNNCSFVSSQSSKAGWMDGVPLKTDAHVVVVSSTNPIVKAWLDCNLLLVASPYSNINK